MADFELLSGRAQAPLHRSPFHISSFPDGTPGAEFYRTTTGYLLRFPNLADFAVSADLANVWCFPDPDVSEATPQHIYLNQVVPLLLSKRGKLVFHASAVEIEGRAIAFVAESGTGKSTLAANFAISGYRFLTDDGLVVERRGGFYHATPSHPSIRLWQDSREQLIDPEIQTAPPLHFTSKSRVLAGIGLAHCDQPRRLATAYFLGDGSAQDITFRPLSASEALVNWLKHSFLLDIEDRDLIAAHFDGVAMLGNELACYHLDYPRRYGDIGHLLQAIVKHATSERASE